MNMGGGNADMELRASLEYYNYYHAQKGDSGLAPPLYDWGAQGGGPPPSAGGPPSGGGPKGRGGGMQRGRGGMGRGGIRKSDARGGRAETSEGWGEVGRVGLMLDELSVGDSADEATPNSANVESWASAGSIPNSAELGKAAFLQKSIIDRIQEDFPRTPSPVFALSGAVLPPGAKPAHAKALPSPSQRSSKSGSSPHLSSPTHAMHLQNEVDGDHMVSQPASGSTGGGLSPLQSPQLGLAPVLEGAGLLGADGVGAGDFSGGAGGLQPMGGNGGYSMDTAHVTAQQQVLMQQQQQQQQQMAAALHALQSQGLGAAAANQHMPPPGYSQPQQLGVGQGHGGYGGGKPAPLPFTNPQMAAALMALNQSSAAATMGGAGVANNTGPSGGEVPGDATDWTAMLQGGGGMGNAGLPDGAQQQQQQQLAALQSLQNISPLALQGLLSQLAMAQAQQSIRGGALGQQPVPNLSSFGQNQPAAMRGQQQGIAPLSPQVMAQIQGVYEQLAQNQGVHPMAQTNSQQPLQRGGGGGNFGLGGHDDGLMMGGPPFGRGRGGGMGVGKGGERGRGAQGGNGVPAGRGSALLEEFRSSRGGSRKLELRDILGHCEEFCRDQHGSRFIQTKLDSATMAEKQKVFEAVLPVALGLMKDLFGNYVCQKFLERGSPEQREALGNVMRAHVLDLSLDMFGCRVVQKAIEVMEGATLEALVSQLQGAVMTCVRDQNGNHVIQKCIECSPSSTVQFIVDDFKGQVVQLGMHPYGCRVIQRILEHCPHSQVAGMLQDIVTRCRELVLDQYGNYVVQHVLEHGEYNDRQAILRQLHGHIVGMSQHKFASNVVEKLLQLSDSETRTMMLNEITGTHMGSPAVLVMMKDPYGNYVIQKALDVCHARERERLVNAIREHLHAVRKLTYGKHIMAHIEKLEAQASHGKMGRSGGAMSKTTGFLGPVGGSNMAGGMGALGGGMGGMGFGGLGDMGTMSGLPGYQNHVPSMSPAAFQHALMNNSGAPQHFQ